MMQKKSTFSGVALALLVTFSLGLPQSSQAQISGEAASELLEAAQTNPLLLLRQRLSQSALSAAGIPLEGAVDAAEYIVGPGDAFTVVINGQDVGGAPIAVGADGLIAMPDAGLVDVGGMTLQSARDTISESLAAYYEDADIDLSLVQSRQFYVHVSGAVPIPGRYLALPVSRVSNVIELAFADTTSLPVPNPAFQPSFRNIQVRHPDGSSTTVDLMRYMTTGDTAANPYLRDGDIVFVPTFNPEYASVSVGGYIPYPGSYEFREGDRLGHVLSMAGGVDANGGAASVTVTRATSAGISTQSFSAAELAGEGADDLGSDRAADYELQNLDVISVQERTEERGLVRIEGRVQNPGAYPIVDGITTLQQVLEAAGGLRSDALARGAYIERRSLPDASQSLVPDRMANPELAARQALRSDTMAVFQRLRLTDLDLISRSYFIKELAFQNRVSMDVEAVLNGQGPDVPLRAGDRLFVPKDERAVYVFGQVLQPGFLPLTQGQSVRTYLAMAGGVSDSGGRTIIINPSTGAVHENLDGPLFSGDMVFVDNKAPVTEDPDLERLLIERERARADARIRTISTIFQGVASVATVLTLIITVRRN
jgi:polysaccharide export outer membrane protein